MIPERRPGRLRGRPKSALLALAVLAALAAVVLFGRQGAPAAPRGSNAAGSRLLGRTDAKRRIGVSLTLRLPGAAALNRFLSASEDPRSHSYGQTMTPHQFGARFGLSLRRLAALREALGAHGLTVTATYPQRTAVRISGTAGLLEHAFSTTLQDRVDGHGQRFYAPASTPLLPSWLHGDVTAVTGLSSRPVLAPADVPAGGLTGDVLAHAYDFGALRSQGINGSGQTVALISFDSYDPNDLSSFESRFGISGPAVQRITINGGTTPGSQQDEVNLDLDTLRSIAPGAQILDYEASEGSVSSGDVINQIVSDHRASVISTSWGRCDLLVSPAERAADETALAAARAAGITIFAASGDNGAYDCQSNNLADQRPSVDWPAASANVIAVGGTRLAVRQDGSYLAEYGWEDVLAGTGSGGGLASATARPSWQQGPGVQNTASDGDRQVPDVAGPADPDSGMVVIADGGQHEIGGTSAAAPFWAASTLLMREYAQQHGVSDLGFLGPLLYQAAADSAAAGAFHQSIRGGNRLFSVGPGWNYVTGLGSPDVAALARELVALRSGTRSHAVSAHATR